MKVAVLGAGASGLTAIKCCQDEGLDVTCYERTDHISGLWYYTDEPVDGQACVMKSTVINTTKETMCYSDFPIPKEMAVFMHNSEVNKYFHMYADTFGLREKIKFNTEVLTVKQAADFTQTGRWVLKIKDKTSGSVTEQIFDAVLVCTGHHADKNMASFPGMDKFQGSIVHSHDYRRPSGYEDKRVVVVGIGNSGGDVAVELSRISEQVFLSTRSGAYIFRRYTDGGLPGAIVFSSRHFANVMKFLPASFTAKKTLEKINKFVDHQLYGLQPKKPGAMHPLVNDDLPNRIATGTIKIKPNIAEFSATSVRFEDGSVEEVDKVILATGYVFGFPFLDESVVSVVENRVRLYKFMFPPTLEHNTLAIIGCFQPLGAIMPMSEQQCRLATRVFKGEVTLPDNAAMNADIDRKLTAMERRYMKSQRHTIQVDYVDYMDQLATLNGNKPNLLKLLFTDPQLAYQCYFGICTPSQFRLHGPGAWSGAKETIMTAMDRTLYPLAGSARAAPKKSRSGMKVLVGVAVVTAGAMVYWKYVRGTDIVERLADRCLQLAGFSKGIFVVGPRAVSS